MNETAPPTRTEREAKLEGMGCRRKRVEDIRFTQGKGNYVDDLKLPEVLKTITLALRGLTLLTGTTGSGKSTTLAAM